MQPVMAYQAPMIMAQPVMMAQMHPMQQAMQYVKKNKKAQTGICCCCCCCFCILLLLIVFGILGKTIWCSSASFEVVRTFEFDHSEEAIVGLNVMAPIGFIKITRNDDFGADNVTVRLADRNTKEMDVDSLENVPELVDGVLTYVYAESFIEHLTGCHQHLLEINIPSGVTALTSVDLSMAIVFEPEPIDEEEDDETIETVETPTFEREPGIQLCDLCDVAIDSLFIATETGVVELECVNVHSITLWTTIIVHEVQSYMIDSDEPYLDVMTRLGNQLLGNLTLGGTVSTVSGSVEVEFKNDFVGFVDMTTQSGDLTLEGPDVVLTSEEAKYVAGEINGPTVDVHPIMFLESVTGNVVVTQRNP